MEFKGVIGLSILVLLFPLLVVQIIPTDSPEPYIFEAGFVGVLGETMNGELRYYLVRHVDGVSPSPEFVVAVDLGFSRGSSDEVIGAGRELWMQGSLMTSEVYYGEQYLFFDLPQIYVRQIRNGPLWPDQLTELRILYLSPVSSLLSPVHLLLYPFYEGIIWRSLVVSMGKTALSLAAGYHAFKRRRERRSLIHILLIYALLAMILTVPVLTDSY